MFFETENRTPEWVEQIIANHTVQEPLSALRLLVMFWGQSGREQIQTRVGRQTGSWGKPALRLPTRSSKKDQLVDEKTTKELKVIVAGRPQALMTYATSFTKTVCQ